jgi:phosphate-selective porin OprO/OprP
MRWTSVVAAGLCLWPPAPAVAQQPAKPKPTPAWNELNLGFTTFRFGGGLLMDYSTFSQDDASKAQVSLDPSFKWRDVRLLLNGRFNTSREITWQAAVSYDGALEEWIVRGAGIMVAVPELWGHFFIGRTKEGISMTRVMTGYDLWSMERFTFNDASIPLLADGIKWLGYLPKQHLLWNLGVYADWLSEDLSYASYDHSVAARLAWVPMVADTGTLLHVGVSFKTGQADEGQFRLRSRPENNVADYFLDTEAFPAEGATMGGLEAFYRPGSWLFGTEYYLQQVNSPDRGDPSFHGGDIFASWLITGETRGYSTVGGYFKKVSPARSVFAGGPGAWEAVLRFSYSDYTDASIQGGTFWRITPMVNWHLSNNARLELVYGYGKLDRFETKGATQFFQTRLQLQL